MQSYDPAGAFNSLWTTMAGVGYDIANWWNSIWQGAGADTSLELSETMMFAMEAYSAPGVASIAITIAAIANGGLTSALLEALVANIEDWLSVALFI